MKHHSACAKAKDPIHACTTPVLCAGMNGEKKTGELELTPMEEISRPQRPFRADRIVIHVPVKSIKELLFAAEGDPGLVSEEHLQKVRDFLALLPDDGEEEEEEEDPACCGAYHPLHPHRLRCTRFEGHEGRHEAHGPPDGPAQLTLVDFWER